MMAIIRTPIVLPELGTQSTLRISAWLVDLGDVVTVGDRVAELLVPGICIEVVSANTGTLTAIDKPVDSVVRPGETLGWIEASDEAAA